MKGGGLARGIIGENLHLSESRRMRFVNPALVLSGGLIV